MTTLEVLRGMRELLAVPGQRCRLAQARDKQGNAVSCHDLNACSWCLIWSAEKVAGKHNPAGINGAIDALRNAKTAPEGLMYWNDHIATDAQVVELLDRAIASQEAKEKKT